jgi:hypothetical protein
MGKAMRRRQGFRGRNATQWWTVYSFWNAQQTLTTGTPASANIIQCGAPTASPVVDINATPAESGVTITRIKGHIDMTCIISMSSNGSQVNAQVGWYKSLQQGNNVANWSTQDPSASGQVDEPWIYLEGKAAVLPAQTFVTNVATSPGTAMRFSFDIRCNVVLKGGMALRNTVCVNTAGGYSVSCNTNVRILTSRLTV